MSLLRCLVKRPDLLVVDGALAPFGEQRFAERLDVLLEAQAGRSLVVVLPNEQGAAKFDARIRFGDRTASLEADAPRAPADDEPRSEAAE